MADLPVRGMWKDTVTWAIEGTDNKWGEGIAMSGYAARHWPDAPARL